MKEKLARFMIGRNGNDQLNRFLLGLALTLLVIAAIFKNNFGSITHIVVIALLAYAYFRMLSRNVNKRREENGKYIRARYQFSAAMRLRKEQWVQRKDYKFFTCPSCKTTLRVPRGHGKIKIVCRKCGNSFTGKS